jgi:hypothetical protein
MDPVLVFSRGSIRGAMNGGLRCVAKHTILTDVKFIIHTLFMFSGVSRLYLIKPPLQNMRPMGIVGDRFL